MFKKNSRRWIQEEIKLFAEILSDLDLRKGQNWKIFEFRIFV